MKHLLRYILVLKNCLSFFINCLTNTTTIGANKIIPTISIPYPLGDPSTSKEEQWKLRYHRVGVALDALATDIEDQTVFEVKF